MGKHISFLCYPGLFETCLFEFQPWALGGKDAEPAIAPNLCHLRMGCLDSSDLRGGTSDKTTGKGVLPWTAVSMLVGE